MTPPNIVYLHSHDTGRFVQPYGYGIPTPQDPGAGGAGRALPAGVLRRADVLGQPRLPADRPVRALQRHARARPPRLVAQRLQPPHRAQPAGRRLPLGADRRAAHLEAPGRDRLRPRHQDRHAPRRRRRAGDGRPAPRTARQALLPVGRVLRDAPRVLRAAARRRVLRQASAQPPGHGRDPAGHGVLRRQRPLARPRRGRGAGCPRALRPCSQHAGHLHHRPRHRLPRRQGDDDRPRARRDADHARAGRVRGRQGIRRAGLAHRHLPDDLRSDRHPEAGLAAGHGR